MLRVLVKRPPSDADSGATHVGHGENIEHHLSAAPAANHVADSCGLHAVNGLTVDQFDHIVDAY